MLTTGDHDNLVLKTMSLNCIIGLPGWHSGKESAWNAGDVSSIPGWEDPLEKEIATHSSILAWKIPGTEDPEVLQSTGSQKSWTWLSDKITTKLQIVSGNQQIIFYWIVNICSAVGDIERWTKSAYKLGRCYHRPVRKSGLTHRAYSKSSTHYVQLISKWCYNPQCLSSEQEEISEATWGRSRQHLAGPVAMVKFG